MYYKHHNGTPFLVSVKKVDLRSTYLSFLGKQSALNAIQLELEWCLVIYINKNWDSYEMKNWHLWLYSGGIYCKPVFHTTWVITAGSIPNNSNVQKNFYGVRRKKNNPKWAIDKNVQTTKNHALGCQVIDRKTPSPPKKNQQNKVKHWEDYRKPKKKGENEVDKRKKKLFTKNSFILLHKL